jgi:hypothetical protein
MDTVDDPARAFGRVMMTDSEQHSSLERLIGEAIGGWREIEITEQDEQPAIVQPHALVKIDGKLVVQCRSKALGRTHSIDLMSIVDARPTGKSFVPDAAFTTDGYVVICSVDQPPLD